jgi:hypothetical protein
MNIEKVKNIIENYNTVPNKDLTQTMVFLKERFELTKKTVIDLTHQIDAIERDFNKLNEELKKRVT